jgi:hypothetical protein
MPERRFDTGYWNDPDIMDLPMRAKLLYLYLWTNRHCNQAGLYEIALKTISFETGLAIEELPELLEILVKKVTWVPKQNLIWVKNFLHRQSKSPQFLAAAAKCLENINNNGLVKEYVDYNLGYSLSIPYREGIDTVSIAPYSYSLSHALPGKEKGVVKGEGKASLKGQKKKPASEITKKGESVINEIFAEMRAYLGFPDKVKIDPIPSYGKEGQAIKRMLTRGFTREEIVLCWKGKVSQRGGEFVSMTWVNDDIGKTEKRKQGSREPSSEAEIAESIRGLV